MNILGALAYGVMTLIAAVVWALVVIVDLGLSWPESAPFAMIGGMLLGIVGGIIIVFRWDFWY